MSWFARSIANTFQLHDDDAEQRSLNNNNAAADKVASVDQKADQEDDSPLSPGRGVKEDLSEITKTLTTKLWGVATFLAPALPAEHSNNQSDPSNPEGAVSEGIFGIRRDFAEIGGRFRSGISKLSTNIDVSEITKLASNILQLSPDGDDYVLPSGAEPIGVTDDVLAFVRDITMHPETWMDFPLPEDEDDSEDFELSDVQQDHALAVERLAPRLAALRLELCPSYMTEQSFWKIYFLLLHPKLTPDAAELLLTPPLTASGIPADTEETEIHLVPSEEVEIVDKSVIQEEPRNVVEDKDEDDWLKEESLENVEVTGKTTISIENDDDDVSFSDLELEDDDGGRGGAQKSEVK